jgi:hypothetical protein
MKRLYATVITFVFGLLLTANVQQLFAQDTICACTHNQTGIMRMVSEATPCRPQESKVCWNVEGPVGPEGPQGPQGECVCPITQEDLDDLIARIEYFESTAWRFHDMGDGTIRDNYSGLLWLKDANCLGTMDWYEAMDKAALLAHGQCGLTDGSEAGDWRLPTKEEWEAFYSTVYDLPALVNTRGDAQWSEGDAFTGVQSGYYWSRTEDDNILAWLVGMHYGGMSHDFKGHFYYVWPVRSGN